MSYGLIGDGADTYGPTTMGMKELRQYVQDNTGYPTPVLLKFVEEGFTNNPQELAKDCKTFAAHNSHSEDLISTLEHLAEAAAGCKERLALC